MSKTFKIAKKRLVSVREKDMLFNTKGYGGGELFSIPDSLVEEIKTYQIGSKELPETWIEITVPNWFFDKADLARKLKEAGTNAIIIE